jgi:hypothetical protein
LAEGADHGGDVAVGQRAQDLERVGGTGNGGSAPENLARSGDPLGRPVGEVGEGAVVNLAILAEGFAEEDGGRRTAVVDDRNIHVDILAWFSRNYRHNPTLYMTTIGGLASDIISKNNGFT